MLQDCQQSMADPCRVSDKILVNVGHYAACKGLPERASAFTSIQLQYMAIPCILRNIFGMAVLRMCTARGIFDSPCMPAAAMSLQHCSSLGLR